VYIRNFGREITIHMVGHIQCVYTVLANPTHMPMSIFAYRIHESDFAGTHSLLPTGATLDSLATTYANEIYEGDEFDVDDEKVVASETATEEPEEEQ